MQVTIPSRQRAREILLLLPYGRQCERAEKLESELIATPKRKWTVADYSVGGAAGDRGKDTGLIVKPCRADI